jgi:hypothetical protein
VNTKSPHILTFFRDGNIGEVNRASRSTIGGLKRATVSDMFTRGTGKIGVV